MKVYLVGGAVRDEMLGLVVKERDWVVVGATPHQLLTQGYKQVGQDFPVFLHPKTHEEYALARTERKQGHGYRGFVCEFDPSVSLEEDLIRRDLTINAMAKDEHGHLIDPYQGERDLQLKQLRHVSSAFVEDPVRVLRLARFAARYHHLGFQVADETRALMYSMVKQHELDHLVAERVWQEWLRALMTDSPSVFIETLRSCGALCVILPEINQLFGMPYKINNTCIVDAGVMALMRLSDTVLVSDHPMIRFAALLLDVGKLDTPMYQWPMQASQQANHIDIIRLFCHRLRIPSDYRDLACLSAQFHHAIWYAMAQGATHVVDVFEKIDAFRRPERFDALLLVCKAWGRMNHCLQIDDIMARWGVLLNACKAIDMAKLSQQHQGVAMKTALRVHRVACVEAQLQQWAKHEK